jgi:hypothetical protein
MYVCMLYCKAVVLICKKKIYYPKYQPDAFKYRSFIYIATGYTLHKLNTAATIVMFTNTCFNS